MILNARGIWLSRKASVSYVQVRLCGSLECQTFAVAVTLYIYFGMRCNLILTIDIVSLAVTLYINFGMRCNLILTIDIVSLTTFLF